MVAMFVVSEMIMSSRSRWKELSGRCHAYQDGSEAVFDGDRRYRSHAYRRAQSAMSFSGVACRIESRTTLTKRRTLDKVLALATRERRSWRLSEEIRSLPGSQIPSCAGKFPLWKAGQRFVGSVQRC